MPNNDDHFCVPERGADTKKAEVLGVDEVLLKRFLCLIRDNYPKADAAMYFLEEVAGKSYTMATANLRDVLSHLATMLQPSTSPTDHEAQVTSAEEHFRRAIQEPYAIALGNLRERFRPVYRRYLKIYPSILKHQKVGLYSHAPSVETVQSKYRAIAKLAADGRAAKRRNRVDEQWDKGVAGAIEAFDKLNVLTDELSSILYHFETARQTNISKALAIIGLGGTLIFGILSVLLVLSPSILTTTREFFSVGTK